MLDDAYLQLGDKTHPQWQNRAHFFAVAAQLMRRIMVDHATQRQALKRGGGAIRVTLDEAAAVTQTRADELLALDEALEKLATFDRRKAEVVEMRYFGGLTMEEIAEVLKVHVNTVARDWTAARAWLLAALSGENDGCNLSVGRIAPTSSTLRLNNHASERAALLDRVCNGDAALRNKVELLLKYHDQVGDFIASPAFEIAPEFLLDDADALIGQHLGHYRIESVLGVGGMGVVYLAHDEQLGRNVALKLLPQSLVSNEVQLERLKREARTASSLNYPNIVTIHEIGEVSGIHYIATEFIEGPTLRERMTRGPIPPNEALEIAQQIASALSVAHDAGIVHCDIKPENVMLRPDGYVKVLDFGIAKFTQQETKSAGVEGTKRYMSPEQARGEELDARSDIWSLGVTVYEMVAGVVPFAELTSAVPPQMSGRHGGLSSSAGGTAAETSLRRRLRTEIDRMIDRMLAEKREARYQSAAELRADLQRVQRTLEAFARPRWRLAAAAIAALALTAALCVKLLPSPTPAPPLHEKSIAVLPFADLSPERDQEYFCDGIQEEILTRLAKIAELKVISRTSTQLYKAAPKNLPEIARQLGVSHILEGTIKKADGHVRVSAQLIDARTDTHLWAQAYERGLADLFAIQSDIAQQIATQLQAKLSLTEEAALLGNPPRTCSRTISTCGPKSLSAVSQERCQKG